MAKPKPKYLIYPTKEENLFRITKVDEDFEVLESYQTSIGKMWPPCNCPSFRQPCKHVKMVRRFAANGCPENVIFNQETDEFEEHFFSM